eukprot:snap_masked-scaffold_17-processed-gene-5.20-mRNA-1 protein AED:1.00 eAED:1.00 QI:0/-1/0/0/-1/1/1/0/718
MKYFEKRFEENIYIKESIQYETNKTSISLNSTKPTQKFNVRNKNSSVFQEVPELVDNEKEPTFLINQTLYNSWKKYVERKIKTEHERNFTKQLKRNETGFTDFQENLLKQPVFSYRDFSSTSTRLVHAVELREILVLHILNHLYTTASSQNLKVGFFRPKILLIFPTRVLALKFMKLLFELLPANGQIKNKEKFLEEFCNPYYNMNIKSDITKKKINKLKSSSQSFDENDFLNGTHPLIELSKYNHKDQILSKNKRKSIFYLNSFETNIQNIILPKLKHLEELRKEQMDEAEDTEIYEKQFEDFQLGIRFNNKKSVKLYSEYYQSDIILASPSALIPKKEESLSVSKIQTDENDLEDIGVEKELLKDFSDSEESPKKDSETMVNLDFLASIEICLISRIDFCLMQNFQNLNKILELLNKRPKKFNKEIDFSNLKEYYLEETEFQKYRQLITTSELSHPLLSAFNRRNSCNIWGQVEIKQKNVKPKLRSSLSHTFILSSGADAQMVTFAKNVLEKYFDFSTEKDLDGLVIVFSKYSDFLTVKRLLGKTAENLGRVHQSKSSKQLFKLREKRKREFFEKTGERLKSSGQVESMDPTVLNRKKLGDNYVALYSDLCEYSSHGQIQKLRWDFQNKKFRIFLLTERFNFYSEYHLKNVRKVVFFGLPIFSATYDRLCSFLPKKSIVKSFYTSQDSLSLEALVGSKLARKMVQDKKKKVYTLGC